MATHINVTNGGDDLLSKAKEQQAALRFDYLEKERQRLVAVERDKQAVTAEKSDRGLPIKAYQRDPWAFRSSPGGLVGVAYRTFAEPSSRSIKLQVGLPGFDKSIEITGIDDPGQRVVNDITLPASGSSSTGVEAVGGLHYKDSRYLYPYEVWSSLDISGVGSPPRLYYGTVPPPLTSQVDTWTPHYTQVSTDKSRVFVLPSGPKSCIFVYLHNKLKIFNIYRRIRRREQKSVNPRAQASRVPEITDMTWYDGRQENLTINDYDHTEVFKAYSVHCVAVTEKGVRQVTPPAALLAALRRISPPVDVNTKDSYSHTSGGGQYIVYGPPYDRNSYFYTVPSTTQQVDSFSDATWNTGASYGPVQADNQVLAQQFGLGYLDGSSHRGPFFTPAVYQYLGGSMNLLTADAKSYPAMRRDYYPQAPFKYLAPCVQACGVNDTDFYVTTTQPSTVSTPVPAASFSKARGYVVKNGESSPGSVLYSWDWGDKAKCKAALLALGFSPADIGP